MLNEIKNVRQRKEEGFRRWFTDDYFDLIVWYDDKDITGFQLCYDKSKKERSLTWNRDSGFLHNKIDDGEEPGHSKMTPILVADGLFDHDSISQRFLKHSTNIEKNLVQFIYKKLLIADVNPPIK